MAEKKRTFTLTEDNDKIKASCEEVAEQIGRTPAGVASHWYAKTSKRPDVLAFILASKNKIRRNRKNGKFAIESNPSIWRRILAVLRTLHI